MVCDFFFFNEYNSQYFPPNIYLAACPPDRWDPPNCLGICDMCYNGGVCHEQSGTCICAPGFTGKHCLTGKHVIMNKETRKYMTFNTHALESADLQTFEWTRVFLTVCHVCALVCWWVKTCVHILHRLLIQVSGLCLKTARKLDDGGGGGGGSGSLKRLESSPFNSWMHYRLVAFIEKVALLRNISKYSVAKDQSNHDVCIPNELILSCKACGEDRFGWDCELSCGANEALGTCAGSQVCLPDPYGCNCLSGFTGVYCNERKCEMKTVEMCSVPRGRIFVLFCYIPRKKFELRLHD